MDLPELGARHDLRVRGKRREHRDRRSIRQCFRHAAGLQGVPCYWHLARQDHFHHGGPDVGQQRFHQQRRSLPRGIGWIGSSRQVSIQIPGQVGVLWIWPSPRTGKAQGAKSSCQMCHSTNGAVDDTFVQFHPTLLPVAKANRASCRFAPPGAHPPDGFLGQTNEIDDLRRPSRYGLGPISGNVGRISPVLRAKSSR